MTDFISFTKIFTTSELIRINKLNLSSLSKPVTGKMAERTFTSKPKINIRQLFRNERLIYDVMHTERDKKQPNFALLKNCYKSNSGINQNLG